ncbi:MAG: PcfB family protein [Firmicutes bacterium]|nr:PcfB family protein [Bacillota bacterium]
MQEEVENRAVTLVISATKLTARLLKAAILKYLASRKEKRLQKARAAPEKPTGKQTVKQLIGQNQGVSNIEITDSNVKSFERVARKYGVDFAVKKDKSGDIPKYLVFFKARDADALTAAFREYTAKEVKRASQDKRLYRALCHQAGAGGAAGSRRGLFTKVAAHHGGLRRRVSVRAPQLPPHRPVRRRCRRPAHPACRLRQGEERAEVSEEYRVRQREMGQRGGH